MAQTTGALSFKNALVEFSTDGSVWTDISGTFNSMDAPEQTRMSGEVYTASGDGAIITSGKREPMDLAVTIVYSEVTGEAFEVVRAAFEAATDGYLRWSPKGGSATQFRFTSAAGPITRFVFPGGDTGSADPMTGGFTLRVSSVTKSVVA